MSNKVFVYLKIDENEEKGEDIFSKQMSDITYFCSTQGYEIEDIYVDYENSFDMYKELIRFIPSPNINKVVIYDFTSLGKSVGEFINLYELFFKENDVRLIVPRFSIGDIHCDQTTYITTLYMAATFSFSMSEFEKEKNEYYAKHFIDHFDIDSKVITKTNGKLKKRVINVDTTRRRRF